MPYKIQERFIRYPLLFIILFFIIMKLFLQFHEGIVYAQYEMFVLPFIEKLESIGLPPVLVFLVYSYLFGYCYGITSSLIQGSKFGGIVALIIIYIKFVTISLFIMLGGVVFILDIFLLPFTIKLKEKMRKNKNKALFAEFKKMVIEEIKKSPSSNAKE